MKFSHSALLGFLLLGTAIAAPSQLEERAPTNDPINLDHGLEDGEIKDCGGHTYDDTDVYKSIQYAVNLEIAGDTRGSMLFPTITFPFLRAARNRRSE